jgi:pimeloyl-ACP methyl ester carboxylesterase
MGGTSGRAGDSKVIDPIFNQNGREPGRSRVASRLQPDVAHIEAQGAPFAGNRPSWITAETSNKIRAPIPFIDYGGQGQTLLFLHANGYPPACYSPLLDDLRAHYHVLAMFLRPLWPNGHPVEIDSWHVFSDDLLRFLGEERLRSVIAVGHSVGAITALRAALAAPKGFAALILLEPVLLPRRVMLGWSIARLVGLGYALHPLIRGARRRRRSFDTLQQVFEGYRRRRVFRYFSDQALWALVRGMTKPDGQGGYVLAYSPESEARVYYTGTWNDWDLWNGISRLTIPTLILRGLESDTFRASTADDVRARNPRIAVSAVDRSTHLVPLERPEAVSELIQMFVQGTGAEPTTDPHGGQRDTSETIGRFES